VKAKYIDNKNDRILGKRIKMKDEKEQLDAKKIAKQREYTQKAEEMLKAGASFLADTGFIQLNQIKIKSNLSSNLVQITYNTPAGIMPIKFKANGTKIYQERPILLNVSKMAYVLYRMIVRISVLTIFIRQ